MKNLPIGALAALLATAATPYAFAQIPAPSPDPSAASSPHQRDVTGSKAPESAAINGSDPGDASSPHQRATAHGSMHSGTDAKMGRQDDPTAFVTTAAQDGMTEVELGK